MNWAVGHILRVHYKSVVMFRFHKVRYVSMLLRRGEHEHISCMCKNFLPAYRSAKIMKIERVFFQS